ncbi:dihydroxyacetone kinase family protein, partial [Propionicimonas sp.]|uniref:dihydroxyacetone kinase family protein n=1 Tax=Propionicimonas sp. TaxID=1955623 RepID=UPI0039E5B532
MTRVLNEVAGFADDVLAGLVGAYPQYVQRVFGGVVRAGESPAGQVAVVIGGGSGHFPAFSGWVGPGLAHAAVQGNVFASPSASQVHSVCRTAENGGGILLTFGNYAGDVLHFGQAATRLRAEGHDVRVLPVTDDVASGPADATELRRGTCGDLIVFKVAAAAAERGSSLDDVEKVAIRANARTRSLGIAFDGCTLPGAAEPLFRVPAGEMSVGLGVHGEPGIREVPMGTAAQIADLLVDGVLAEEPVRAGDGYTGRAVALLNGLGTVKYEELLIAYARVAERLAGAGIEVVRPEVGELMSSLDMAGLSLTVCFLDAELEELWCDPVETVSFRRGGAPVAAARVVPEAALAPATASVVVGTEESKAVARSVRDALAAMNRTALAHETALGRLDAVAGDGDHGQGMTLGSTGALAAADRALSAGAGARSLLIAAGEQWAESAGGTSGALWGSGLVSFAGVLDDSGRPDVGTIVAGVAAFARTLVDVGGAQPGDKTMMDAVLPFAQALATATEAGAALPDAWRTATATAAEAAADTAAIV